MHVPRSTFVLLLGLAPLACDGGGGPPCAFLELQGETAGGGAVILEDAMDSGDRSNRAIAVEVTGVPEIPSEDYRATYTVDCEDEGCEVDVDCTPDIVNAGQAMFCDVFDVTEEGTAACDWSCRIAFEVSHGDNSICAPARVIFEVLGRHEPGA